MIVTMALFTVMRPVADDSICATLRPIVAAYAVVTRLNVPRRTRMHSKLPHLMVDRANDCSC